MQVDTPEQVNNEASTSASVPAVIPVDLGFDLDAVAANYSGRTKITRLLFIASNAPALRGAALTLALQSIVASTLDVALYEATFDAYNKFLFECSSGQMMNQAAMQWYEAMKLEGKEMMIDRKWIETATREARSGQDRLEVELKGYTTNLIKESIRMGHRDLALFYECKGDLLSALKAHTKSRDYCTTTQHALEMCLGFIGVALEMNNYSFVRNFVVKAEAALESLSSSNGGQAKARAQAQALPGMVQPGANAADTAKDKERAITAERLAVAGGIAHLGSGNYDKAAYAFTGIGRETLDGNIPHYIPPADIALYAVLTGLASFNRVELRTRLLENAELRPMIDLEPYLRDIIRAFYASQFKEGLALLDLHQARQRLDIHLSSHVDALLSLIRSRALLSYFAPFASVSISRMAVAFGAGEAYLTKMVVHLIETGQMKARIDSKAGVLVAKKQDVRTEAFRNALREGENIQRRTRGMTLRMRLLQAEVVVKGPKGSQTAYETY